jgi:hypothetical protein
MWKFFSKLSSKPETPKPETLKFEDWNGWCEDIAKFCKEKADWYQEHALLEDKYIYINQQWLSLHQSRLQRCKGMILLCRDQDRCFHEEEVRFHKDRACFHRGEACKFVSRSRLHENEARFHEERVRFHQGKVDECKWIVDALEAGIHYYEDSICYREKRRHWREERACFYRELASLYQVETCSINLRHKKLLNAHEREKELDIRKRDLVVCTKELDARWDKLYIRCKKLCVDLLGENDHGYKLNANWKGLDISYNRLETRIESFEERRLQLLQHPDVIQRRKLIRVLQNIYQESTHDVIKLVLNWLKSSILKELNFLGIEVVMTA